MGKHVSLEIPIGSLVIDGAKISRVIGRVNDQFVLRPEDASAEDHLDFYMTVKEILSRQQDLKFQIRFSMSSYLTGSPTPAEATNFVALDEADQDQVLFWIATFQVLDQLIVEDKMQLTEMSIDENHEVVEARAKKLYRKITVQRRKGMRKVTTFDLPRAKRILQQYRKYSNGEIEVQALASQRSKAGRKPKEVPNWVEELMDECLVEYRDDREPHLIRCYEKLQGRLLEENERRAKENPLHRHETVSERRFRGYEKKHSRTPVRITRKGRDEINRTLMNGSGDLIARMVGEIIQVDEYQMPLWLFLQQTGLHKIVGPKTMARLRKEAEAGEKGRIWLLVAIDVATGMPLAFHLANSQNPHDTVELLRRLVSDKRQMAREAGCEHAPPEPVRPYMIVMDTGSGLWNDIVPRAILAMGASFRYGRVRTPTDKAVNERYFRTFGGDVMKAVHGYAGEGPGKKTSYDGWEMTSMSKAQLERLLWWYFTDCYPFKTTQRKGGYGVTNGGLFEMTKDRYGMLPALGRRDIRDALGLRVGTRTVGVMGIEVYRMPYKGTPAFNRWMLDNLGAEVSVTVDPYSMHEVTAVTPDGQRYNLTACLSQFRHFSLAEWLHFLAEWRASDPVTKEVSAAALHRFYERLKDETNRLLAHHGKEHKPVRLEEAERMTDELSGVSILLDDGEGSPHAAIDDALSGSAELTDGPGVYTPGGDDGAAEDADDEAGADTDPGSKDKPKKRPTRNRKYTGPPKGKGGLE
jgi:hypothetical protein